MPERRNSDESFIKYILEAMDDGQTGEPSTETQVVKKNVSQIHEMFVNPISIYAI